MPEGGYLVNTARGDLVVMDDLLWALEEGPLAGPRSTSCRRNRLPGIIPS